MDKIAEKAVCRSAFLTIWHCILSGKLTKTHSLRTPSDCFFGDFAHWEKGLNKSVQDVKMLFGR